VTVRVEWKSTDVHFFPPSGERYAAVDSHIRFAPRTDLSRRAGEVFI